MGKQQRYPGETNVKMEAEPDEKAQRLAESSVTSKSKRSSHDSDSSSSSSTDSSDSEALLRKRGPQQYIPIYYEELVQLLGRMVDGQKSEDWAMHWRVLFSVNLPLYANVRTVEIFKPLIEQYEELDPTPRAVARTMPEAAPAGASDVSADKAKVQKLHKSGSSAEDAINALQRPLAGPRTRGVPTVRLGLAASPAPPGSGGATAGSAQGFREDSLDALLQMCGFQEVPKEFIKEAEEEEGRQGLNVHVPSAGELPTRVYFRSLAEVEEERRAWQSCYCQRSELSKLFLTLVFVYSYNYQPEDAPEGLCSRLCWRASNEARRRAVGPAGSEGKVFLHAYNSISLPDMDMLWPGSKPNPTFFDVVSIFVPLLVGLGSSIWKIVGLMADVDDLTDTANLLVILFAIVGPFSIAFRYFMKAKNKYYLYKARHADTLVQHTHSTNRGTLASLLEDATAQESKEIVVAYTLLAIAPKPITIEELRSAANNVLSRISSANPGVDYDLDFDAEDPVRDLEHLGVLVRHEDGGLSVKDLPDVKRAISLKRFEQQTEKRARARLAEMRGGAQ
eukprot:jgi/Ulvmu1/6566/UM003_0203.1